MTVGERIQINRKKLGMSQEELGQRLLVSRQTISLWEKDQTVPTIDNLIRLKEIFGLSVDELLGYENKEKKNDAVALEAYQFKFTENELKEIYRIQKKGLLKKPFISILIWVVFLIFFIISPIHNGVLGFAAGMVLLSLIIYAKGVRAFNKQWEKDSVNIFESTYEYKLFEDYIYINIYRRDEKVRESKCYYTDIQRIEQKENWMFLKIGGQLFIVRKRDLKEDSVLFSSVHKKTTEVTKKKVPLILKILSVVLFVVSILSFWTAMVVVVMASVENILFVENMWMFFLFAPIPISSVVLGIVLKSKGYNKGLYLKNIIVGLIMTVLLCLFGSFSIFFSGVYDHSNAPIIRVEQKAGIEIPEHRKINTQDWTKGTQSVTRGYIYYTSDVYFSDSAAEDFEKRIQTDNHWVSKIPSNLLGIVSPTIDYEKYDYFMLYNLDTSEYNVLPHNSGTFRFINILYIAEDNQMKIVEYDMDYTK